MLKSPKTALVFMNLATPALLGCTAKPGNVDRKANITKSICEAATLQIVAKGLKLILDAEFVSDRKERSFLQDERCPTVIVVPFDGSNTVKDEGYRAFERILNANPFQMTLLKARVTVYGTLRISAPNRYRLDVIRYIRSDE